jgi:hypothetical protein
MPSCFFILAVTLGTIGCVGHHGQRLNSGAVAASAPSISTPSADGQVGGSNAATARQIGGSSAAADAPIIQEGNDLDHAKKGLGCCCYGNYS